MKMQLDASAVRALIEDDQGFEAELRRCVVAEIIRKSLLKDAKEIAALIAPDQMAEMVKETAIQSMVVEEFTKQTDQLTQGGYGGYNAKPISLSIKGKERVAKAVDQHISQSVSSIVGNREERFKELLKEAEETFMDAVKGRVERYMDHAVKTYFERDVSAEVKRRIEAATQVS